MYFFSFMALAIQFFGLKLVVNSIPHPEGWGNAKGGAMQRGRAMQIPEGGANISLGGNINRRGNLMVWAYLAGQEIL